MTARGRGYLLIVAARHALLAVLIVWSTLAFPERSYRVIDEVLPLSRWAAAMFVVAALALLAAASRRLGLARLACAASVAVTAAWALGFWWAAIDSRAVSPSGPVSWSALAAVDALMVVREFAVAGRRDSGSG